MKFLRFKNKNLKLRKGFTLVELLVAVAMLGILSAAAYIGISRVGQFMNNSRVEADLLAIENALERYYDDNDDQYPVPEVGEDKNLLCFNADTSYSHDCENAAFIQGMVDNKLMTKRYLQEVPTDPRTGSRYVYSVSQNGRHFQVAGIVYRSGEYRALVRGTLDRGGFPLASMIRAYDGSDFVMDEGTFLPYSPDHLVISATLDEVEGRVGVCEDTEAENCEFNSADTVTDGDIIYAGDTLVSDNEGSAILYFSDGSVAYLYPDSTLAFQNSSDVEENDEDGIITKIRLKLLRGEIWNKVVRLSAASEYNIETTSAIAGIRGTEFGVKVDNSSAVLRLYAGEVVSAPVGTTDIKTVSNLPSVETGNYSYQEYKLTANTLDSITGANTLPSKIADRAYIQYFNNSIVPVIESINMTTSPKIIKIRKPQSGGGAHQLATVHSAVAIDRADGTEFYKWEGSEIQDDPDNDEYMILEVSDELLEDFKSGGDGPYGLHFVTLILEDEKGNRTAPSSLPFTLQAKMRLKNYQIYGQMITVLKSGEPEETTPSTPAIPEVTLESKCASGGGYWYDGGCWILGDPGQACSDPDGPTSGETGACEDFSIANKVPATCDTGNWDVTLPVCTAMGGSEVGTAADFEYAPYYASTSNTCKPRGSINQNCSEPGLLSGVVPVPRICKCQ